MADDEYRLRSMRIPDARWEAVREAAERASLDRTAFINRLLAWFLREPGARQPKRPDPAGE